VHYLRSYRIPLLIFGLALAIRLLFFPYFDFGDRNLTKLNIAYDGYYEIAENLQAGNGFTRITEGQWAGPDSVRTPLYPLFIVAVVWLTGSYKAFLLLQVLIGSLIPLLGRRLAEMMTGNHTLAVVVGVFLAVEPFTAWLSTVLLTETFFTFFFLLGFIALFSFFETRRTLAIVVSAALLGCATLTKPTPQALPLLFCLILIVREWKPSLLTFKQLGAFLVVFFLVLSPWMYRNYTTFGTSQLNVQSVSALFSYLVPSSIALERGIPFQQAQDEFHKQEGATSIEDINLGNMDPFKQRALEVLREYPVGFFKSLVISGVTFFIHDGYLTFTPNYAWLSFDTQGITLASALRDPTQIFTLLSTPGFLLIMFGKLLWLVITPLAAIGLYLWARAKSFSSEAIIVAVTIAYFAATTTIIGLAVNGRFRNPLSTFLVTCALLALFRFYDYSMTVWYKVRTA
jgi:4-amino-4-deoxy-L-arabinose transferase-like glycosyltransferase